MAINLSKSGDFHKIDLSKKNINQIQVHANLNWRQQSKQSGFFNKLLGGGSVGPDLDLGCMFEMNNGQKGVIQPLGGYFGSKTGDPYIFLDKDDRTGAASEGENMYILRPDLIKRVMFFALIYSGASNFQSVGGHMAFSITNGESISLQLNNPDSSSAFCTAAMFSNKNGELILSKEERYFKGGHKNADDYYGFGFNWVTSSK